MMGLNYESSSIVIVTGGESLNFVLRGNVMGRAKTLSSYADYETHLKRGAGCGEGQNYLPWLTISQFNSQGNRSGIQGIKTHRHHHLMSNIETEFFYLSEYRRDVIDIREQFPLLPLSLTNELAVYLGFKHPAYTPRQRKHHEAGPRDKEILSVMTTDFLLTVEEEDGSISYEAISVKPAGKISIRTAEKLEIERLFWTLLGVSYRAYISKPLFEVQSYNVAWATAELRAGGQYPDFKTRQAIIALFPPGVYSLVAAVTKISHDFRLDANSALVLLKTSIGSRIISVDLSCNIPETGAFEVVP